MKTLLPLLLLVFSGELWAQSGELWFSGGASVLSNHQLGSPTSDGNPADVLLYNAFRVGFRFTFNSAGHIGHEIQYAHRRTDFGDNNGLILTDAPRTGMAIHHGRLQSSLLFPGTKEGSKVQPWVTRDVDFSGFALPASTAPQGSSVKVGINEAWGEGEV
jgi:hypothetical protein